MDLNLTRVAPSGRAATDGVFSGTYDCWLAPDGNDGATGAIGAPWQTPARAIQEIKRYTHFVYGAVFRIHLTGPLGTRYKWSSLRGVAIEPGAVLAAIGHGDRTLLSGVAFIAGTTNPNEWVETHLVTAGGYGTNTYTGKTLLIRTGQCAGARLRIGEHSDTTFIPVGNSYRDGNMGGLSILPGDTADIIECGIGLDFGIDEAFNGVGCCLYNQWAEYGSFTFVNLEFAGTLVSVNSCLRTIGCEDRNPSGTRHWIYGGTYLPGFPIMDWPDYNWPLEALILGAPPHVATSVGKANQLWSTWASQVGDLWLTDGSRNLCQVAARSITAQNTVSYVTGSVLSYVYAAEGALVLVYTYAALGSNPNSAYGGSAAFALDLGAQLQCGTLRFAPSVVNGIVVRGAASVASLETAPTGSVSGHFLKVAALGTVESWQSLAVPGSGGDVLIDGVSYTNAAVNAAEYIIGTRGSRVSIGNGR